MKIIKIKDMRREKKAKNKVSSKALQHKKEEFEFEIEKGVRKTLLSSCFYIVPVKIATAEDHKIEESKDIRFFGDVMEYRKEAISIEDEYVSQFLCYFLNKRFNKELNHAYRKAECFNDEEYFKEAKEGIYSDGFEWYLTYNVYTYEDILDMLSEIKELKTLLATDYYNPRLDGLKNHFCYLSLCSDEKIEINLDDMPSTSWWYEEALKEKSYLVIDFYDRFIYYMEKMMKMTPACSEITFVGP